MALPALRLDAPGEHHWPAQGQWTWNDYLRLPEDGQRYEIIEGVLYVSPAPIFDHQFFVYMLFAELHRFVSTRKLGLVIGAPFDVLLPGIAGPVQPDLLLIGEKDIPRSGAKNFTGVPRLIVEVLSAGNRRLDRVVKARAYARAGVEEYWLADPDRRTISVHSLVAGKYVVHGRFGVGDKVRSVVLDGFATEVEPLFPR